MLRHSFSLVLMACLLAACGKGGKPDAASGAAEAKPAAGASAAAAPALLLSPEDLRTLGAADQSQGPVITGSIQPERRADLRAEVSAVVLQVLKENGEPVRTGDLLVKLDDTAIRDSLASAEESARAAGQAFEQAERQVERLKTLQAQGMTSVQALEDAQVRRNSAQSELAAARARVVSARQQMQRTLVRAPFDGVVSDRKVSAGDTAQVGKELVKVIDPRSMRFEGLVSADRMKDVQAGQDVRFRINGAPQVAFADPAAAPRVSGLYAEGRIAAAGGTKVLSLPASAIVQQGGQSFVWRVKNGTLNKVPVQLGPRDARSGDLPVVSGLAEGEQVLRNPGSTLADGQKVEFSSGTATAAASGAALR
jgi:multidrug efflux pump subunit AcrA (membrane-fusion protein)